VFDSLRVHQFTEVLWKRGRVVYASNFENCHALKEVSRVRIYGASAKPLYTHTEPWPSLAYGAALEMQWAVMSSPAGSNPAGSAKRRVLGLAPRAGCYPVVAY
jgi:hypothetical protein